MKKPIHRSKLRQFFGKEFYILKRKIDWVFSDTQWATNKNLNEFPFLIKNHKSIILRKLKDVDMYLQENKRTNLKIAIQHLNNIIIKPGETFSFWKLVGRPTSQKGYLEGLVLNNGKIDKGIGGGLCQIGNLLFWLFAHSPLEIKERYRHGYDVFPDVNRTVPFGSGATLAYNYIDLQVYNSTPHVYKLEIYLDKTYLNGALFSDSEIGLKYSIEERNHIFRQENWGGYTRHNQIYQIIESDTSISEKLLVENHAIMMYSPYLSERNKK
jgi:vancomycin resistance protein VanW